AHARWAIATADDWGAAFTDGARQQTAADVFDAERANFRAALAHLLDGDAAAAAQRLATAHWRYWLAHGAVPEGIRWLTAALDAEPGDPVSHVRAAALQAVGNLTESGGDLPGARRLLTRAAAMFAELGDTHRLAGVWNSLAL